MQIMLKWVVLSVFLFIVVKKKCPWHVKFLSLGSNLCYRGSPSHSSDNTGYLSCCTTRELLTFAKFFFFFVFLGPHPRHTEFPRLGVELELQLPAYTTATAMPNPCHVCNLHHSSGQRQILNSLSQARDQIHNLMVISQIRFPCATTATPYVCQNFKR